MLNVRIRKHTCSMDEWRQNALYTANFTNEKQKKKEKKIIVQLFQDMEFDVWRRGTINSFNLCIPSS